MGNENILDNFFYSKNLLKNYNNKNSKNYCVLTYQPEDYDNNIYIYYDFTLKFGKIKNPGYTYLKLEESHYFSENSQFGMQYRQVKGGSIRAFGENIQQLIQLIKVHLIPLLEEIKKSSFYQEWMDKISKNDEFLQDLIRIMKNQNKGKSLNDLLNLVKTNGLFSYEIQIENPEYNSNNFIKKSKTISKQITFTKDEIINAKKERDEAISHIKDKWVSEIDGGRLWQMNRPANEQGLDYSLTPHLFFGIHLEDPLQIHKSIKEQLDDDIYTIDVSKLAKEQIARFIYKFYTWLPTAIKNTEQTFKLKISSLKQFYSQIQLYIEFIKPILLEISKKLKILKLEIFSKIFPKKIHNY